MADDKHKEKLGERKSILNRSTDYRDRCSKGFKSKSKKSYTRKDGKVVEYDAYSQVHHIVCDHAVTGRQEYYGSLSEDDRTYLEDCLYITDWDLNNPENLIGLPTRAQYKESKGMFPIELLTSHNNDHNDPQGYTGEVSRYLRNNIWNKIRAQRREHEFKPVDLAADLKSATNVFAARLTARGIRQGGHFVGWLARHEEDWSHRWYHPFSMGNVPAHRHPGPPDDSSLDELFKKLGWGG